MDINKHVVAIDLDGTDPDHYADFDNAVGFSGVEQILLRDEGVILTSKHMEEEVRAILAKAKKYFAKHADSFK